MMKFLFPVVLLGGGIGLAVYLGASGKRPPSLVKGNWRRIQPGELDVQKQAAVLSECGRLAAIWQSTGAPIGTENIEGDIKYVLEDAHAVSPTLPSGVSIVTPWRKIGAV